MEIGQYQPNLDGDGLRIGIVQSRFNEPVCNGLVDACTEELERLGVIGEDVLLVKFRWRCKNWLNRVNSMHSSRSAP
jgi:6,7-dimethyl-8-ribityllumazine synthase